MKTISIIALVVLSGLLLVPARSRPVDSLQQQIVAKEREELDAVKTGDIKAFASLIADDALFVDARGTDGKENVVKHTADFKLIEYSMENVQFVPLSEKSGVIAYKLTEKASAHGHDFTATIYASAIWVERDSKWVCVFSQETTAR
jgi:ketosteroid isomerase-like protein